MTDQLIPGDLLYRSKVIAGLRQLADYLHDHPAVPVAPFGWDVLAHAKADSEQAERAEVDRIAAILGVPVTDDTAEGGHYRAIRSFGLITYEAVHIPKRCMEVYDALMSYRHCVTPADPSVPGVTR